MKRRTKAQKCQDCFDAFKCIQEDKKVKRSVAKDGSIPTHPVVSVQDKPEKFVLADCLTWLWKHNILCNRNNVGTGQMGTSGIYSYGIKNGGDIIGLLRTGEHFEIECKKGSGGRLSLGQQKRQRQVRESKGIYYIVHGVEELEYYFKKLI